MYTIIGRDSPFGENDLPEYGVPGPSDDVRRDALAFEYNLLIKSGHYGINKNFNFLGNFRNFDFWVIFKIFLFFFSFFLLKRF